jgi:bloom syndrome protein
LNIRISPNKRTVVKKPKAKIKKRTDVDDEPAERIARIDFASTYVSSPIREASKPPKRKKQTFIDAEAEVSNDSDDAFETATNLHANGYARDNFVVDDDADEDYMEDMAPIGQKRRTPPTKSRGSRTGQPITGNPLLDPLEPDRRDFVENFVQNARPLGQTIMERKGLKNRPFSDTVLRLMAIKNVKTKDQMKRIEDIRHEMVELYGEQFLSSLSNLRQIFQDEGRDVEEKPYDANKQIVVDLCSDDEDEPGNGLEVDYDETEDEDEEDDDGPSGYFTHTSLNHVQADAAREKARAWQAQFDSLGPPAPAPRGPSSTAGRYQKASPKRKFSGGGSKKSASTKAAFFARKVSGGGTYKKGVAKKRKSSEGGARSRTGGGGVGGGKSAGGISLMPT